MKKIAITGGIGTGKSAVCQLLAKHGACILNSDDIIHELLKNDLQCIQEVVTLLGPGVLNGKGINRKKVAEIVFQDENKLRSLETLLHPRLLSKIEEAYERKKGGKGLFVVELPLVQEIGKEKEFDLIVAVRCDSQTAKKRFISQGFSEESYENRMRRQWDCEKKCRHADVVIRNDGTEEELENQVLKIIKEINPQ
ncbi:MAG: dephospho-CoA kinase [Chlamydiia bacterium]|nr:dephospho-CoA kinase [Chlamydiia bacterium]